MVQLSKKEVRKASKGKDKAPTAPVAEVELQTQVESDWTDSEEEDEDEDEENGGVSEKGMRRLMELVGEEDLDEFEKGLLAGQGGSDEEDDEEDGEDDEEDGEDEDSVVNDDDDEAMLDDESDSEDEGEEADDSVFVDNADPDALRLDDLDSNASLDEDAVPMRKVTANNKPAMRILTEGLKVTHLPWPETLVLSSKDKVECDPSDDLKREMAFYKVALDQVAVARKLAAKHDIPFTRPSDYYAEMVKSDEHMERIRTKLVDEAQGIKKSEAAKKQRDLKKYGKQIQVEKLKQREMDKKQFQDRVQGVKRKRQEGAELGGGDEFDIDVDDAMEDRPQRGGGGGGRGGRGGKPKMPRSARDNKYSLGGGGRRSKENTKESTADFAGWGGGGRGRGRGGRGGGRGGSRGGAGGRGGGGGKSRPPAKRPGKSRRK